MKQILEILDGMQFMQPSIFEQMVNAVVEHYDIIGAGVLVLIVYSVSRLLSGRIHKDDE